MAKANIKKKLKNQDQNYHSKKTEIILMWIASMPALTKLGGRRPLSSWLWHGIAPHNDREVHVACIPAWDHHHLGWILARGPIVTQGRRDIKNLGGDKPLCWAYSASSPWLD